MKIKTGDMVKVMTGGAERKGKVGKVLEVLKKSNRVRIEGVAKVSRHLKPQRDKNHPEGGIVEGLGTVHASNVMLMSESQGRPVRVGYQIDKEGRKVRVARGRNVEPEVLS